MGGAISILLMGLYKPKLIVLKGIFAIVLAAAWLFANKTSGYYFFNQWRIDDISVFLKYLLTITGLLLLLFKDRKKYNAEYYFLMLSVFVGSFLMLSAYHFLLVYLAVEITSYASYFLTGWEEKKKSIEGTVKYYLFGAVSSAVMLFGMSLVYGDTGSLYFTGVKTGLGEVGVGLLLVGLLFKTSVAPFHIWSPGAYQVGPTQSVALFSVVPKLAAFGLIYHLSQIYLSGEIGSMLLLLAIFSIIFGTLSALRQQNVKRLLAYGAVAHSGFLLPLVVFPMDMMQQAFAIYAVIYAIMNVAVFYLVDLHEEGKELNMERLSGLGKMYPYAGAAWVIILIALTGLPPTAGFTAKFYLFSAVWSLWVLEGDSLLMVFFVVGIISSAVSLFYYLKVPYYYFFKEQKYHSTRIIHVHTLIATFFAILLLLMFIQPDILNIFVFENRVFDPSTP